MNENKYITICKNKNIILLNDCNSFNVKDNFMMIIKCQNSICNNSMKKSFCLFKNYLNNEKKFICTKCISSENLIKSIKDFCEIKNIVLLDDYSNLIINNKYIIKVKCSNNDCNNIVSKNFDALCRMVKKYNYCYCTVCNNYNMNIMRQDELIYCNTSLEKLCSEKNIILLENYDNILVKRDTYIKARCLTENCMNIVEKKFGSILDSTGCYCIDCTNKIKLNKIIKTNLERYGTDFLMHNSNYAELNMKKRYCKKIFTFPSGKEISVQGYEPLALNELINNFDENEILTGCKNVPNIKYDIDGKSHRHYVDIYLPTTNTCIEVKSTWTFEINKDKNLLKQLFAKNLGYNYEIWIYNNKGEKVNCIK